MLWVVVVRLFDHRFWGVGVDGAVGAVGAVGATIGVVVVGFGFAGFGVVFLGSLVGFVEGGCGGG